MLPLVTAYTVDNEEGLYAKAADQLAQDCARHGLELHRMPFGSRGPWLRNTLVKPIGLMEWIEESYRAVALKRLVKQLDEAGGVASFPKAKPKAAKKKIVAK